MDLRYELLHREWVRPATGRTIIPVNASPEQPLGQVPEGTEADIDRAMAAARAAFDDSTSRASGSPPGARR